LVKIRRYNKKSIYFTFIFFIPNPDISEYLDKNIFFLRHAKFLFLHFLYFFIFYFFIFWAAGPSAAHMGWAQPSQPARPLAQANGPAGQKKKKHA
jgi:hypothetical protein